MQCHHLRQGVSTLSGSPRCLIHLCQVNLLGEGLESRAACGKLEKKEKKTYGKLPLKCRLRLTMSSDLGIGRIFLSLLWCALRQWKRDAWGRRSKVNSFLLQQRWEAISKQKISPNHRPGWAGFIFSGADFYSPWAPVTPCTAPVNQSGEYSLGVQSICLPPDMEQLLWISHHSHPH